MSRWSWLSAVSPGLVFIIGACQPGSPTGATGKVNLAVTDAPFPLEFISHAVVTLGEVRLRRAGDAGDSGSTGDTGDADDVSGEPFVSVFEGPVDIDLIDLRAGVTRALASTDVPVGSYNQIRLVVAQGEITLTDGRTFPLVVPSGQQSGIKLNTTFDVTDDGIVNLLLDFDLGRAFVPIPGGAVKNASEIRDFHFKPSQAVRAIDQGTTGSVGGKITDAASGQGLAHVAVSAVQGDTIVAATSTVSDGSYALLGLAPGSYEIRAEREGYQTGEASQVVVAAGQVKTADIALTAIVP